MCKFPDLLAVIAFLSGAGAGTEALGRLACFHSPDTALAIFLVDPVTKEVFVRNAPEKKALKRFPQLF